MPIDVNTLFDAGHLAAFLGGTSVGAAGTYLADRFTDQRRTKEAASSLRSRFQQAKHSMPKLFDEMTQDLKASDSKYVHQLAILPSRNVIYSPDKDQFTYYESEHDDLLNQVLILQNWGLIVAVQESSPPVYRMSEEFMRLLKSAA